MKERSSDRQKLLAIGMWVATRSIVLGLALVIAKLFPIAARML